MDSRSALTIHWTRPDIEEERWEFFNHPAKQEWYQTHGITWEQIIHASSCGSMVPYPRGARIGTIPIALSYHHYEEYQFFLARAKRGYRKSYSKMEDTLQKDGELTLPAPTVLCSNGAGLLFSGYRRLCLGWNYGMTPYIFLISTP